MRSKILTFGSAAVLASSMIAAPAAYAGSVEWYFFGDGSSAFIDGGSPIDVGPDETYQDSLQAVPGGMTPVNTAGNFNPGGRTVTAYGFAFDSEEWLAADLLENNRGTRERGLGIEGGTPEIDNAELVVIDLGAGNLGELSNWMIQFNSVDGDEAVTVWTSDMFTPGTADADIIAAMGTTALLSGSDVTDSTAGGQDLNFFGIDPMQYLFITASGQGSPTDIMVSALKAEAPVPEPASLSLLGLGLAGLGAIVRRRRKLWL